MMEQRLLKGCGKGATAGEVACWVEKDGGCNPRGVNNTRVIAVALIKENDFLRRLTSKVG